MCLSTDYLYMVNDETAVLKYTDIISYVYLVVQDVKSVVILVYVVNVKMGFTWIKFNLSVLDARYIIIF